MVGLFPLCGATLCGTQDIFVSTGPLVASDIQAGDGTDATAGPIDTSTATGIKIAVAYASGETVTPSDNKSNVWVPLTAYDTGGVQIQQFYCASPTVGSGHTFTASGSSSAAHPTIAVMAFSGVDVAFDDENGSTAFSASAIATGVGTPAGDNELFTAAVASDTANSGTFAIDGSFLDLLQVDKTGSTFGLAFAWKLQTTGGTENPIFSWTPDANSAAASIAVYKAASSFQVAWAGGANVFLGVG